MIEREREREIESDSKAKGRGGPEEERKVTAGFIGKKDTNTIRW